MVIFSRFLFEYSNTHINSLSRKIVVFIYFFHMQSFVFISGFFSSENPTKKQNGLKLLIILYIFNYSVNLIFYFYESIKINFLYPLYSYWYILSLFYRRITIKYSNNIPLIFIFSIIISLLEGYRDCFSNVLAVYKTIVFFSYFLAGYKFAKMKIIDKVLLWKKSIIKHFMLLVIFFLFSYLVKKYIGKNNVTNEVILILSYNNTNKKILYIYIYFIEFLLELQIRII